MWGGSQLASLVEAAKQLDFVKLRVWSMKEVEDEARETECLQALKDSDVLFLYPSRNLTWEKMESRIKEIAGDIPTVCLGTDPSFWTISSVDKKIVAACQQYLTMGGVENLTRMLKFIGKKILGLDLEIEAPVELPWEGIYHPRAEACFNNLEEYLKWYKSKHKTWIGLLFYRSYWVNDNLEVEKALIREFENQGANVLAVFSHSAGTTEFGSKPTFEVISDFFLDRQGKSVIDALVNLQMFLVSTSSSREPTEGLDKAISLMSRLNIPVFRPVMSYYKTRVEWEKDLHGLGDSIGWSVALPEFEGMIEPIMVATTEKRMDQTTGVTLERYLPIPDRIVRLASRIKKWVDLGKKNPQERKVAFILNNSACAGIELSVGGGSKLDTLESVSRIMKRMKQNDYKIENMPSDGKALIKTIMDRKAISEFRWTTVDEIVSKGGALALLPAEDYIQWFDEFPRQVRERLTDTWGNPPGEEKDGVPAAMVYEGKIVITGVQYGNVVICCQPKRGCAGARCDGQVCKILHDPEIPPPHQYLATYRYLENKFGADVLINVGTHGSQEFLPGKSVGLSASCYPDLAIDNLPYLYIYNADNPAEGTIAKRRGPATLIDHMQTVMTEGGLYEDLEKLEQLLGEYHKAAGLDPAREHMLRHQIKETITKAKLKGELKINPDNELPFDEIIKRTHEVITRIRDTQIPDGMHVFGDYPRDEQRVDFIHSILRYDFGDGISTRRIFAQLNNIDLDYALGHTGELHREKSYSIWLKHIDGQAKDFIREVINHRQIDSLEPALTRLRDKILDIARRMDESKEIESLLNGFEARYIQPGPSGLITRGRPDVLPTGRNFYSLDPEKIPTRAAWLVGMKMADALIKRHQEKTGQFPENLGMVWFCSDVMRADGEEMAQLLYLIGVRPAWQTNGKVKSFEIIPLKELGRPRIDITVRASGITRDCFPNCIELLDEAIQAVASLPESPDENFLRKHALARINTAPEHLHEVSADDWREATLRIFTSKPGTYGSGVNLAVAASAWKEEKDLSDIFLYWNGYAYGKNLYGKESHKQLVHQLGSMDLTFNNACTDESDLLSCCCYFSVQGGMAAAAKSISGKAIANYYGDTRNPSHIGVTDLADEIRRIVRTKLLNPKWIEGMKRHGYKGAGDIAKRVGRVYGWESTTQEVDDWIFDDITRTFVMNEENRRFFQENSPWALEEIARRLLEAHQRGLWKPDPEVLQKLKDIYLEIESWMEENMGDVKGDFQGGSVDIFTPEDVLAWKDKMHEIMQEISQTK